jgi:hypothetical protein
MELGAKYAELEKARIAAGMATALRIDDILPASGG